MLTIFLHKRFLLGLWLLVGTLVYLQACSLVEPPPASPVETPPAFSRSGGLPLPDRWWLSFEDDELDSLIEQALAGNLNLKSAWDRLDQARAIARRAGAELYPTLDAETGASRIWQDIGGDTKEAHDYSAGFFASYEIDLWGRVRSSRDAARIDAEVSTEDLMVAGLTLSAQVADTWFQLIEQQGQLKVLREQIITNSKALELITLQFRTGQVGIADVLQQRQLIETNRGEMAQVTARARVLENQLAILLGEPPQSGPDLTREQFAELPPLPDTGVPADLLKRRPDVRSAWLRVLASDQRVATAIADRFPRLGLTGRVETSSEHARDLFDDWLSSLAANLAGPLVDGGRRRAEIDRTRAAAAQALHEYGQTVLDALGEVEDALTQEQQQRLFLASLDRQLELAGQSIERIRDRYLKGAEDYQRVLTALVSYQTLQRRRLTAQRELIAFRISLCRALGGGWQMERPQKPQRS